MEQTTKSLAQLPTTFIFHEDATCGWLAVPYTALVALGIEWKITHSSYRQGDSAYLEMAVDAGTFIQAWSASQNIENDDYAFFRTRCKEIYQHLSFIHELPHFYVD